MQIAIRPSLPEINGTIKIENGKSFLRKLLAYTGPGALVAVGYMDPGNWITSIAGGAQFAYTLLFVILISNLIAMLLQSMSARLGIVTGLDLAQAIRHHCSKRIGIALWVVTELAIMATDIAEIIGSAIALKLLFDIPLMTGVMLTIFDVFSLLVLMHFGFRKIEAIVMTLIFTVFAIFLYEVILAEPNISSMMEGFLPHTAIITNSSALFISLGIVGATVMPHNLFLHSSLVQVRRVNRNNKELVKEAIRFANWDSNIQLSVAFVINCLLLILGAALFYGHANDLGQFQALYDALKDPTIVGHIASPVLSVLFAVALLASGQNSTITGTLSGQIVMEGFINIHLPFWLRRLVTRSIAVVPVIISLLIWGESEQAIENLLIYSQVFLSLALPIAVVPLIRYTTSKKIMGEYIIPAWMKYSAWSSCLMLIVLNFWLIITTFTE